MENDFLDLLMSHSGLIDNRSTYWIGYKMQEEEVFSEIDFVRYNTESDNFEVVLTNVGYSIYIKKELITYYSEIKPKCLVEIDGE